MRIDAKEGEKYAKKMTQEAELSRDRRLTVKALLTNGEQMMYFGTKDKLSQSITTLTQGLRLAQKNNSKRKRRRPWSCFPMCIENPDLDKSLSYAMQASSIASTLKDDSVQVVIYTAFGTVYQQKKERLLALRNYLNALRVAEV
jgi:hypothetical protein